MNGRRFIVKSNNDDFFGGGGYRAAKDEVGIEKEKGIIKSKPATSGNGNEMQRTYMIIEESR